MEVGDYIKHNDSNTGEGPDGSWVIREFSTDDHGFPIVVFSDHGYCLIGWIEREFERHNAMYIHKGNGMFSFRDMKKHKL